MSTQPFSPSADAYWQCQLIGHLSMTFVHNKTQNLPISCFCRRVLPPRGDFGLYGERWREENRSARGKHLADVLSGVSERDVNPGLLSRVNTTYTPVIATRLAAHRQREGFTWLFTCFHLPALLAKSAFDMSVFCVVRLWHTVHPFFLLLCTYVMHYALKVCRERVVENCKAYSRCHCGSTVQWTFGVFDWEAIDKKNNQGSVSHQFFVEKLRGSNDRCTARSKGQFGDSYNRGSLWIS